MSLAEEARNFQSALHQPARSGVRDYLRKRGLTTETIDRFQLGYSSDMDGVTIPYFSATGKLVMLKIRRLGNQKPKYLTLGHDYPLESATHIFNVAAVVKPNLVICEGEFDAMILAQEGLNAISVPGANAWQDFYGLLLPKRATLLMDPDDAGTRAAHEIRKAASRYGKTLLIGKLTDGDVTETYIRGGGITEIQEAISAAQ